MYDQRAWARCSAQRSVNARDAPDVPGQGPRNQPSHDRRLRWTLILSRRPDSARSRMAARSIQSLRGRMNRDWWPNQLNLRTPASELLLVRPDGQGLQLRRGVQEARPGGCEEGSLCADDRFAGLVAGRFRPLWRPVHPHGMAQRRHLPHRRWPRRRRFGHAALRAAQQLARQRQPRQGAPAALADQAEVRQQDLLGRPDDPCRQLRAGVDGLQDLRLRRRPRGRLGAARRTSTGAPRTPGSATSATAATATSRTRSPPCRWA